MSSGKVEVSLKLEDIPMIIDTMEQLQQENKQLKEELEKYKKIVYICDRSLDKMHELEKGE